MSETLPHLKITREQNVTVRNDPDGRSRLNVNIFDGNIIVTDFGDVPLLGNIQTNTLQEAYENGALQNSKIIKLSLSSSKMSWTKCSCKNSYYPTEDFLSKQQILHYKNVSL